MRTTALGLTLVIAALLTGCSDDRSNVPTGRLTVAVAPLNLSGIINADYTITVTNDRDGSGEVVWTRAVTSSVYGDGAGSVSYVGTCDASTGVNTVTLQLTALYDAGGLVPAGTYMNPTPLAREATCVPNADVAVQFDITVARRADQGFFDVAVEFEDIFCSAKLDCQNADGTDLDLLHDANGDRDMTVVLGFACTGSPTGSTYLYMDDPIIACTNQAPNEVLVDPTGSGNVALNQAPNANPGGYLFAASVFRGVEGLAHKAYWNISFGLDATRFGANGTCELTGRATASDLAFPQTADGFPIPTGAVYPVIDWNVTLSNAGGRVCTRHEVNDGNGVATNYVGHLPLTNGLTWDPDPITLDHRYEPTTGIVLSAAPSAALPYASCVDARDSGETASQIYTIDPDGAGPLPERDVYCDMVTDGGGWMLMAKFSQHESIATLSGADYDAYFGASGGALWIEGHAMAAPTTPVPAYDAHHVESVDWREHLVAGHPYELRQNFFKGAGTAAFDVKYDFAYNGHVKQDAVTPFASGRAWPLTNRTVLSDATGISWNVQPPTYFWLPFTSAALDGTPLYSGCAGYAFEATGCTAATATERRFGDAGIIDTAAISQDQAASWAPLTKAPSALAIFDLVYVFQATATYGQTGAQMALLYWIREKACVDDGDCASGLCGAGGACAAYAESCAALRAAGQTTSAIYTLDRDGAVGGAAPVAAYCDMTTDGGGWMYVAETGRSQTNPADTWLSVPNDYHRYIYDLRGFQYDEVLVVRPAGFYWCNSWGTDSTYWGPDAATSMGIAYDTEYFHYHNGEFTPSYAWIQQPYGPPTIDYTTGNTTPSAVAISTLDGATGAVVKLDPPGATHSELEVSNFDAFVQAHGGCSLGAGHQATWQAYVRAATTPSPHAQLTGPMQTFPANAWTSVSFDSAPIGGGASFAGGDILFEQTGVYRVTLTYRPHYAAGVWTGVRLAGAGVTRGVSAGYGNIYPDGWEPVTVSFLAEVPDTGISYQLQLGRGNGDDPVQRPDPIGGLSPPALQASFERIDDLVAPTRSFAQLQGPAQVFGAGAWTAATWDSAPISHGITTQVGPDLTFSETGVYRVTLSFRGGAGADTPTAAALFGGGSVKGISAGHGNVPNSPELITTSFLANVDDLGVAYQIAVGRVSDSYTVITPNTLVDMAPLPVQATITRESGVATSYAQLEGGAQTLPANAWTGVSFDGTSIAQGITVSGADVSLSEPGVYRITLSYRHDLGANVYSAVRFYGGPSGVGGHTAGMSAGFGNVVNSHELFTLTWLADVESAGTYQIQLGRLNAAVTIAATSPIVGVTPPAVQATIVRLP